MCASKKIYDFRERKHPIVRIEEWQIYVRKQWEDFSYKLGDGECVAEVKERSINALEKILETHGGKNIVIATHGMALSIIINHYDAAYGFENFMAMVDLTPWIVKMEFCETNCAEMEKINLFEPSVFDYENCVVKTAALGELKAYRFVVIFARHKDRWLYCRHKKRDTFETAGGRIEEGETPLDAAKRELFEETGAAEFEIEAAFDYSVHLPQIYSNGQVFFAKIKKLGELPAFEMAEVKLFDAMPEKMRFPKILPVLYVHMQFWINLQSNKDEICDVYDAQKNLTGVKKRRADILHAGEYFLTVLVWILNSDGKFLITQRSPNKGYPLMWECTGGLATAGDDSLAAAIREVKEETGLSVLPQNGRLVHSFSNGKDRHLDVWLFRQNFDLREIALQEGETVDARFATPAEIKKLIDQDKFLNIDYFNQLLALL
jgi:8-oxo-dGTP diphosphatase